MKTPFLPRLRRGLLLGLLLPGGSRALAQIDFAPANDLFAQRTGLGAVMTASLRQDVFRASTEYGDPVSDSVWWQWTAPQDGWWEVEIHQPENGYQTTAAVQVFRGDRLHSLIVAPDGGIAVPEIQAGRRLFQAKAGQVYQLAFQCPGPGTWLTESRLVDASLRPARPAANTSLADRTSLTASPTAASGTAWTGQGWATAVTGPVFELPDEAVLYAPLYWTWTCPADGNYSYFLDRANTAEWGLTAAYRGTVPGTDAFIDEDGFTATAGEVFTFVTGNQYYPSRALRHHALTVVKYNYGPAVPTNEQNPFLLTGALPRTVTPPAGAPKSDQLWWTWQCPVNGWVEFEGTGLKPDLEGTGGSVTTAMPEIIARDGKFYFWVTTGSYRLAVAGWTWPAGGTFTLRPAGLTAPGNDLFSTATVLPSSPLASVTGTFLGAGRQLGDPAATPDGFPFPTVWYCWQPPANGLAEVYVPFHQGQSGNLTQLRVFSGNDPAYLSEVPVSEYRQGNPLLPAHHQFSAAGTTIYYLCFSGMLETFDLRIQLVGEGVYPTDGTRNVPVKTIAGSPVAEGHAPTRTSPIQLNRKLPTWFKWTASGTGLLAWVSTATVQALYRGAAFNAAVGAGALAGIPLQVSSGETYWFECIPPPHDPMPDKVSLRLYFTSLVPPLPGDDPAAAVSLGTQLPVGTACHLIAAGVSAEERGLCHESIRTSLRHAAWYRWTAPPGVQGCGMISPRALCDVFADAPGGPRVASNFGGQYYEPQLFAADPGRTYYLMVQATPDQDGASVPLSLIPYQVRPAANDDLSAAAVLSAHPSPDYFIASGVLAGGDEIFRNRLGSEPGEPPADPSQPAATRSAWWRWTAPRDGIFSVDCLKLDHRYEDGIDKPTARSFTLGVYHGAAAFPQLVRVRGIRSAQRPAANSFAEPFASSRRLAFRAETGQTYLIQTSSEDEFGGISVSVAAGDPYDVWALGLAGVDPAQAGPEDNPSGDGYSNLLKFCLGLNPARPLPQDPLRDRAPAATLSSDGRTLSYSFWSDRFNTGFSFPFPANGSPAPAETARIIAQRSGDLSHWSPVNDAVSLGGNRWRVDLPINGTKLKDFVRLRAEWVRPSSPQ